MIDWIKDLSGNWIWRSRTLWELKTPVDSEIIRNNINVGHHDNFVTIKSENQNYMHMVMLCGNYEKYDLET